LDTAAEQSSVDAAADHHAQVLDAALTEAAQLGIPDEQIAAGAKDALADLRRQAAMQIAQGMLPASTLALMLQLKGLLGVIAHRRSEQQKRGVVVKRDVFEGT
jgi:hypothetical protein